MVLVPFIYHTPSLTYDFSKLMHVWLTSLSMFKIALTFWFSLTAFHLSKWDEIWHAYHAVGCDWSWFIWWFLEMFKIAFELSLAVDFYELLNALLCPNLFMKWWWWLIWMWTQLVLFLDCLNMILDACPLLFWLFHSLLTLNYSRFIGEAMVLM